MRTFTRVLHWLATRWHWDPDNRDQVTLICFTSIIREVTRTFRTVAVGTRTYVCELIEVIGLHMCAYIYIYILIRNCSVSFLFYRADLTENHQRYYEISSVLPLISAADAAVNAGSNICRRLFGCGSNYHSQSPFLLLSTLLNFIFSIISSVWKRTRFMRSPCCVPMRSP